MEGGSEVRPWDELIPDTLGMIFSNLCLQEILTVIPRVCKSWGKAVAGPYCWQEIDIEGWSIECRMDHIGPMIQMLVTRSGGSVRKLNVCGVPSDDIFSVIADHAGSLQDLRVSRSDFSDAIVQEVAHKLSTLTFLDLSCCLNVGAPGLEAIGKHCKSLRGLQRAMHPLTVEEKICQNDEAHAIATTMPKLKHLELSYMLVDTVAVHEILLNCPEIEYLDLRGCWNVTFDEDFLKDKFSRVKVLGPVVEGSDMYWEYCSDFSESDSVLAWELLTGHLDGADYEVDSFDGESFDEAWDDEQRLEELELRYYEAFVEAGEHAWPPS